MEEARLSKLIHVFLFSIILYHLILFVHDISDFMLAIFLVNFTS